MCVPRVHEMKADSPKILYFQISPRMYTLRHAAEPWADLSAYRSRSLPQQNLV